MEKLRASAQHQLADDPPGISGVAIEKTLNGLLAEEGNKRHLFDGEPAVKVLTMHSSKGLEFESVFIPGICEIGQRIHTDPEEMKQEAKLLYVAMTRALGTLTMLHHASTPLTERIGQAVKQIRTRLAA